MKRIVFVLLLAAMGHAQEVRGPFDLNLTGEYPESIVVARCNTEFVEFVAVVASDQVFIYRYFFAEDSLFCDSIDIVDVPEGWYGETYGPIRWGNNWSLISDQSQADNQIDFRWNRTVLITSESGEIIASTLDSGRTHPFWVDSLWSNSFSFELFPRTGGGFVLKRSHSFAELDSSGEYAVRSERLMSSFHGNGVYPVEWTAECHNVSYPHGLSLPSDSVLLFSLSGSDYDYDVFGCYASPSDSVYAVT
ncbi:MAG: hypothetical protein IPG71_02680 [bacterium]|nr:hypothetical protein [bacterium]